MRRLRRALAFLAAAGAAVFLSSAALALGAGSSQSPAQWKVRLGPASWSGKLTALYPGARDDTEVFAVTVDNAGNSTGVLHSVTVSLARAGNGDAETTAGSEIRGCRAGWFTISITHPDRPLPARMAPRASYAGRVDLTMRDSGTNQNACRGASPAFTVTSR